MMMETQRQPIPFSPLDRMASLIAEHLAITAALYDRDADAVQDAMVPHIRNTETVAGISILFPSGFWLQRAIHPKPLTGSGLDAK